MSEQLGTINQFHNGIAIVHTYNDKGLEFMIRLLPKEGDSSFLWLSYSELSELREAITQVLYQASKIKDHKDD